MSQRHNPNPFDFVPFPDRPLLKTESEYLASGDLLSGYLEVRLKALTPVHVVGSQNLAPGGGRHSHMYRQGDQACIPAASIRGCLRAFLEALTAGWVSQATPEYEKEYRKRHLGFATFADHTSKGKSRSYTTRAAIDSAFQPMLSSGKNPTLDLASFMFGVVFEPESGQDE